MQNKILDVAIDFDMTLDDVVSKVDKYVSQPAAASRLLCTTNPYFVISASKDKSFKSIINGALLSVPDGVGVLYANLYLKTLAKLNFRKTIFFPIVAFALGIYTGILGYINRKALGNTVTGVDLTDKLCELAAQKNYTVFFLGGRSRDKYGNVLPANFDMASAAKKKMELKYPNVRIIGASSQFNRYPEDDNQTINYIHKCMKECNVNSIDFLFVAYNPVDQEKWIQRNSHKIPAKISVGVGRVFDYITNSMQRPPEVVDKLHIAWLYAFVKQPWRLKRILMTFPTFPIKVFLESIK